VEHVQLLLIEYVWLRLSSQQFHHRNLHLHYELISQIKPEVVIAKIEPQPVLLLGELQ
jgi:hypothetical protein